MNYLTKQVTKKTYTYDAYHADVFAKRIIKKNVRYNSIRP